MEERSAANQVQLVGESEEGMNEVRAMCQSEQAAAEQRARHVEIQATSAIARSLDAAVASQEKTGTGRSASQMMAHAGLCIAGAPSAPIPSGSSLRGRDIAVQIRSACAAERARASTMLMLSLGIKARQRDPDVLSANLRAALPGPEPT